MSDPQNESQTEAPKAETPTPPEDKKIEEKSDKNSAGPNPFDWISTGTSWGASLVQTAKEKVNFKIKSRLFSKNSKFD